MRILLVEDDDMIGAAVQQALHIEGYALNWVQDAANAEMTLATETYELVLLDLGLPDYSGLSVLTNLRKRGNDVAVIILTARDTVAERIEALDIGADDFLVKPFDLDELSARIRAVQRRLQGRAEPLLKHGKLILNPASHVCTMNDVKVDLSAREFTLLQALMECPDRVLSRTQLEEHLYPWGSEVESNTIEVHIHHLRKKLGSRSIHTLRGVGYLLGDFP